MTSIHLSLLHYSTYRVSHSITSRSEIMLCREFDVYAAMYNSSSQRSLPTSTCVCTDNARLLSPSRFPCIQSFSRSPGATGSAHSSALPVRSVVHPALPHTPTDRWTRKRAACRPVPGSETSCPGAADQSLLLSASLQSRHPGMISDTPFSFRSHGPYHIFDPPRHPTGIPYCLICRRISITFSVQ